MKSNILPAIKLTILSILLLVVIYPIAVWSIAQLSPNNGKGMLIEHEDNAYYANIGQLFTEDKYFSSRPSAVDYNAAGSGASNKGASNPGYLAEVQSRIDSILVKNPGVNISDIPVDLITASGSGLDPNISVQGATIQVNRIASVRNIPTETIYQLIEQQTEQPLLGVFGPSKINVLKLNIALDTLK